MRLLQSIARHAFRLDTVQGQVGRMPACRARTVAMGCMLVAYVERDAALYELDAYACYATGTASARQMLAHSRRQCNAAAVIVRAYNANATLATEYCSVNAALDTACAGD